MNTSHLRRSVVAVALAVATLMTMANPAGAAIHNGTITGGILTSTKTGALPETFNLAPTTPSCTSTALTADFGTEIVGGQFLVTAFNSSHDTTFTTGSFHVVLSRSTTGNSAGTWTSGSTTASHTVTSSRIAIVIQIYSLPNPVTDPCEPSTLLCTAAVILHITSTFPTSLASGNPFSATGSSVGNVVAFTTCGAGPSQILGMSVAVTSAITGIVTT